MNAKERENRQTAYFGSGLSDRCRYLISYLISVICQTDLPGTVQKFEIQPANGSYNYLGPDLNNMQREFKNPAAPGLLGQVSIVPLILFLL